MSLEVSTIAFLSFSRSISQILYLSSLVEYVPGYQQQQESPVCLDCQRIILFLKHSFDLSLFMYSSV